MPTHHYELRALRPDEWPAVAEVICASIRTWYAAAGKPGRFPGGAESCLLFPQVYERLDPGCCIVAVDPQAGRIAASCFYHPRPTHISLGIMTAHPDYFGRGAARLVLQHVCDLADRQGKPLRLVSSAMNLDSFSLYTRAGFTARAVFHTMTMSVPPEGLPPPANEPGVRDACPGDAPAMASLEWDLCRLRREGDWRHILQNEMGIWHVSVLHNPGGQIDGFLASVNHPGSNMLGPGVMRTPAAAAALIRAELNVHRGRSPVWLVPATCAELVKELYAWGARNVEIHLLQVRGRADSVRGVMMPTFMPETG